MLPCINLLVQTQKKRDKNWLSIQNSEIPADSSAIYFSNGIIKQISLTQNEPRTV